jgi:DNA-binding MarR family transcriptional regulator
MKTNFNHPPDIGIGKLLRRAHMAFSRELRLRLAAHNVSFGEFTHLERLWHEDGLNQTEISRRVGIETASSTTILDRLEKRGFVRRVRNGDDRRNINVFLKPSGAKLKDKLLGCAKAVNLLARSGLKEREVLTFFRLMERIANNLETSEKPSALKQTRRRDRGQIAKPGRNSETPTRDSHARI